jgi:hypothetical protein
MAIIDLSDVSFDAETPIYTYAEIALRRFLNVPELAEGLRVRAYTLDTQYPEIKEKAGIKSRVRTYVLAVVDMNRRRVFLEGWCDRRDLLKKENKYKNYYIKSFKDLKEMELLNASRDC